MTKQKIFFSYSRADGSLFALRLAKDLKKNGFNVWIDQQDIRAGLKWDAEIEKALENSDCVLFIETEKSVLSNYVLDEVYYAMEQNKKVIPLIFVDSKTPFRLQRLQHIDFTQDYDTGFALLINELEGVPYYESHHPDKTIPVKKPVPIIAKQNILLLLAACIVVLVTVVILLTRDNKTAIPAKTKAASSIDNASTNSAEILTPELPQTGGDKTNTEEAKAITSNAENRKRAPNNTVPVMQDKKADVSSAAANESPGNLNETLAGDWKLIATDAKVSSHNGYLKIEAVNENKATIKSYMQFYYPESKASSYLTVFNAFAGCVSCVVKKEMKLQTEDVAIASRTIKTLQQDQPGGGKAGDVILDASSNKSIRASTTLQFIDNNNAVLKVQQPNTIPLAHELMLEPFVYTFRFRKIE